MKTSLLILFASLAVAAAQPGSNFEWVSASDPQTTSLYIVNCNVPTELQFVLLRGKGVWIEKSPACRPPKLHSTRHLELDQQGDVNSDRVNGDFKFDKLELECQVFAVMVPGSRVQESKISETIICIDNWA